MSQETILVTILGQGTLSSAYYCFKPGNIKILSFNQIVSTIRVVEKKKKCMVIYQYLIRDHKIYLNFVILRKNTDSLFFVQRGSYKVWEINMEVCPRFEFDDITLVNWLGYDF